MSFPKEDMFELSERELGSACRILGYPARIRILNELRKNGAMRAKDICQCVPLHPTTVSEHLRKLRLAGLIDVRVEGLSNWYTFNEQACRTSWEIIKRFFTAMGVPGVDEPSDEM